MADFVDCADMIVEFANCECASLTVHGENLRVRLANSFSEAEKVIDKRIIAIEFNYITIREIMKYMRDSVDLGNKLVFNGDIMLWGAVIFIRNDLPKNKIVVYPKRDRKMIFLFKDACVRCHVKHERSFASELFDSGGVFCPEIGRLIRWNEKYPAKCPYVTEHVIGKQILLEAG